MIIRGLLALLLIITVSVSNAQTTLRGRLTDTVNFSPMAYSTVLLVRASDSVITHFTYSNQQGEFSIRNVDSGKYRLLILRPSFADYEDALFLNNESDLDLGVIVMLSKANLLKEVIIREKSSAIRIRGDTTEYLVDSFLTNKNATVEDLLKRLPGIQVDKNGEIKAQGQTVKKVLVDGEEFFGNDPTMATRNLRAEDVEKVQVFDKQNEQAAFSGIDDGEKEKTINLQLKEEARNGYFGKLGGAYGTNDRYDAQLMGNVFSNKRKVSGYVLSNNINKLNLGWDESDKYGGGSGMEYDAENGYYTFSGNDDYEYNQIGVPRTTFSGVNYSDKTQDEKHSANISLSQKNLYANGFDRNYTKYILPDTIYYNNQNRDVTNKKDRYGLNFNYQWNIDSLNTIRIKTNTSMQQSSNLATSISENRNGNNELVNQNDRFNRTDGTKENFNASLLWMRKFKTKGRSLSWKLDYRYDNNRDDELVQSTLRFYDTAQQVINSISLDQKQLDRSLSDNITTTINYTEPLVGNKLFLLSDYTFNNTNSTRSRTTNALFNNEYSLFVDSLSNKLRYATNVQTGGVALRYVYKKWNATAGGKAAFANLSQHNEIADTGFSQSFINFFPSASINYKIKQTSNFTIRYNGNTQQPRIDQIQPIRDLSNPLLVMEGNPNLVQSFRNQVSLTYNTYQPIKSRGMWSSLSGSWVNDDFTQAERVDEFGRRNIRTVNVNGNANASAYLSGWISVKQWNVELGANINPSFRRNVTFINGQQNVNLSQNLSFGPNIGYMLGEVLELNARADWSYNTNTSSLRKDVVTNFWISTYSVDARARLPKHFEISTDCDFNIRQQTQDFRQNLNTIIWNASIAKRLLKSRKLVVSIDAYDLLNQNLGFMRTNQSNFVNEHVYSVLQRYVLLRVVWNFNKGGTEEDEDE